MAIRTGGSKSIFVVGCCRNRCIRTVAPVSAGDIGDDLVEVTNIVCGSACVAPPAAVTSGNTDIKI